MRYAGWIIVLVGCRSESALEGSDPDTKTSPTDEGSPTLTEVTSSTTWTTSTSSTTSTSTTTTTTTPTTTTTSTTTGTVPLPPCAGGSSFRDTLPPLPPLAAVSATLAAGSGTSLATCQGDAPFVSSVTANDEFASIQAHNGGLWYFEATTTVFNPGWSMVSVYAAPSEPSDGASYYGSPWASADYTPSGPGTVSVAVDLDAGHAWFYEGGNLVSDNEMSLDPGVGAFHAHLTSMTGNQILLNTGAQPFAFEPPPGFQAWSSDAVGTGAPCINDFDVPAPAAPITASLTGGYDLSTFLSDAADPTELVLLGIYEPANAGGTVQVTVNRSTPVTLALVAYDQTNWNIVAGPTSNLVSIVAFGYANQTVVAPGGVPVSVLTYATGGYYPGTYARYWPYSTGGGDAQEFVSFLEEQTCLPLKMFGGSYQAGAFTVD